MILQLGFRWLSTSATSIMAGVVSGSRVGRGHDPEEEKEKEGSGLRPREIWKIWKTSSALGDSCSPRTRTQPKTPIPPQFFTLPSRGWEAAAKARAQRQPALPARGRARRHVTTGTRHLMGHVNFQQLKGARHLLTLVLIFRAVLNLGALTAHLVL